MTSSDWLDWPFFEPRHRGLAAALNEWCGRELVSHDHGKVDDACRGLVRQLGDAGWLRHAVGGTAHGGAVDVIDTRAICLLRETLAFHHGLADFAFAMQGLGSGAISLHGTAEQRARYLPKVASGQAIAAFALSEPEAGSDVAAMACSARDDGDAYVLDGEKTWISNGGIADFYVLFARTGEQPGSRGITALIVDAGLPGFEIARKATNRADLQLRMQGNAFLGAFFSVSPLLHEFRISQEQFREVVHRQYVKKFGRLGEAVARRG